VSASRRAWCIFYGLVGVLALVGTWTNNLRLPGGDPLSMTLRFWEGTLVNPASRSVTVDIVFLCLPVICWMLAEARRLRIRAVWAYVAAGFFIGISVAFPVFMLQRERALARAAPEEPAARLGAGDLVGLGFLSAFALGYLVLALRA
jgi:hypothetical protein